MTRAVDAVPYPVARRDQVGSQQRPPELLDARTRFKRGELSREQLTLVEDRAILTSLRRQESIGIEVVTDGEFRRDAWMTDVQDAIEGFAAEYPVRTTTLPDGSVVEIEFHGKPVVGKLRQKDRIAGDEATFLRANAVGQFKITMPSPNAIGGTIGGEGTERPYQSREELVADLLPIYMNELRALATDGVPYLQFDQTIGSYTTPRAREQMTASGRDPASALQREVSIDNECLDVLAGSGITLAKHFCRGSRTTSRGEGDYLWYGEQVFPNLHVDRFLLEWDSDAVGGFEPLQFIPKGKVAVLGLVTSKYPELEDRDMLLRKIEEASRYLPIEQLAISPQCGFGGSAENNFMTVDEQWKKLENMVAVAQTVWG